MVYDCVTCWSNFTGDARGWLGGFFVVSAAVNFEGCLLGSAFRGVLYPHGRHLFLALVGICRAAILSLVRLIWASLRSGGPIQYVVDVRCSTRGKSGVRRIRYRNRCGWNRIEGDK